MPRRNDLARRRIGEQHSYQSNAKHNSLMVNDKRMPRWNQACLTCPPPALDVRKRTGKHPASRFMKSVSMRSAESRTILAKFFAQDGVIRVSLGDASPQQLLRASVRLRDF